MYSLNRVQLVGYQTQPVEVRQTPGGMSVTDLNLVVPYAFTSESGQHMQGKSFQTVTMWGSMADIAGQYVRPGAQVFIAGRLQTDSWDDEQSGEKRSKTKVVAQDLILLDPKDGQSEAPAGAPLVTSSVNRADVVGNVTRDPEVRTTTSGQSVVSIGVATNERWKDKASGEDRERTEFHNIVVWGQLATQVSVAVKKGARVFASGRVQTRSWETQSGSKRTTTEIIADQFVLLGVKNSAALDSVDGSSKFAGSESRASAPRQEAVGVGVGDIPEVKYASEIKVEDLPF